MQGLMNIPRPAASRFALLLISFLVVGCISTKGCGDPGVPMVRMYNRTLASVTIGDAWGAPCEEAIFERASWPSAPPGRLPAPPGTVPLSVDLAVLSGYAGSISIIVSSAGIEFVEGIVESSRLPRCAGAPPSSGPVGSPAESAL